MEVVIYILMYLVIGVIIDSMVQFHYDNRALTPLTTITLWPLWSVAYLLGKVLPD